MIIYDFYRQEKKCKKLWGHFHKVQCISSSFIITCQALRKDVIGLFSKALLERTYKPHYNHQNFPHWPMEQKYAILQTHWH